MVLPAMASGCICRVRRRVKILAAKRQVGELAAAGQQPNATAEWGIGVNDPFALPERSRKSPECFGLGETGERPVEGKSLFDEGLVKRFHKQAPRGSIRPLL